MKAFYDQIEHLFGIRIEAYFPYIIGLIGLFFFFDLRHQIITLENQVAQVQMTQTMTGNLSKSDLIPLTQSINLANDRLNKVTAQTTALADNIPDIENELNLANQKLTYLENEKDGQSRPITPAAAENKSTPVH
jgi:hypothetical protein